MKSIDIAKDLSSSTVRCIKKKIKYNLVRYNIVDDNMYSKIIQTPFTIIRTSTRKRHSKQSYPVINL